MTRFLTPVSMLCTPEQFEADLRKPLEAMGYEIRKTRTDGKTSAVYTASLRSPYTVDRIENICYLFNHEAHEIAFSYANLPVDLPSYQPELFLAYAAMSDAEYGVPGEWWVLYKKVTGFTIGKLYKAHDSVNEFGAFIDDEGRVNGRSSSPLKVFRKATKEEIDQHFAKEGSQGTAVWGSKTLDYKDHPALKGFLGKIITEMFRSELNDLPLEHHVHDEMVPTLVNNPWPVREVSFKDEKPYEPKNGDKVIGFDHELSSAVQPREGTYIGWDSESERHLIRVAPQQLKGYKKVKPVPAEPEVTFEPGELVWVKFTASDSFLARFYASGKNGVHRVFNFQRKSGDLVKDTTKVVEIHKFDKRPF